MNILRKIMGYTNHRGGGLLPELGVTKAPSLKFAMPDQVTYPIELSYLRECRPLEDQGQYPMCGAFAGCCDIQAAYWLQEGIIKDFKEAPLYYEANQNDGIDGEGTTINAIVEAAKTLGYCQSYTARAVQSRNELRWAVWKYRRVLCGFRITDNWNKTNNQGVISDGGEPIGGHAVVCCGYTAYGPVIANSWGTSWGLNGYGQFSWESFDKMFMGGLAVEWDL